MTTKDQILDKLWKIKALAEQGEEGEKEVAQKLLQKMMEAYNITDDDLSSEIVHDHEFYFEAKAPFAHRLLCQIAYSVFGDIDEKKGVYGYVKGPKNRVAVTCTDAEFVEIAARFDYYIRMLAADMKTLYKAFVMTNNIYPKDSLTKPNPKPTPQNNIDTAAISLSLVLEKHNYHKQIKGGSNE